MLSSCSLLIIILLQFSNVFAKVRLDKNIKWIRRNSINSTTNTHFETECYLFGRTFSSEFNTTIPGYFNVANNQFLSYLNVEYTSWRNEENFEVLSYPTCSLTWIKSTYGNKLPTNLFRGASNPQYGNGQYFCRVFDGQIFIPGIIEKPKYKCNLLNGTGMPSTNEIEVLVVSYCTQFHTQVFFWVILWTIVTTAIGFMFYLSARTKLPIPTYSEVESL